MTSYNTYPILLSALAEAPPQAGYHLNVVQAKRRGLIAKEQIFKKKYKKYYKILNRITCLNACSSGISIATGISNDINGSGDNMYTADNICKMIEFLIDNILCSLEGVLSVR